MASVRTFRLPHYEDYPVQVAMFTNVSNAAFLRSQLLEANPDFDYAFLDATMILSPTHVLTATFHALHGTLTSRAKTRTPHSELVYRLHSNNNIGESYRKFGISDTTINLIAVKLPLAPDAEGKFRLTQDITNESVSKHLGEHVKGESLEIGEEGEDLGRYADVGKIGKVYKLDDGKRGKGKKDTVVNGGTVRDERKEMESVILGVITLKGS